jgi:hypothetical protein
VTRALIAAALGLVACFGAAAQTPAPATIVRLGDGVAFELPEGWDWSRLLRRQVDLHLSATGGTSSSNPNRMTIDMGPEAWVFRGNWSSVERDERGTLPNGAEASLRIGETYPKHRMMRGTVRVGRHQVEVTATRGLEEGARAFAQIARTMREIPPTDLVTHPERSFSMATLPSGKVWAPGAYKTAARLYFVCYASVCRTSNLAVGAYPASTAYADLDAALASITGFFAQNNDVKIGAASRQPLPNGEAAWTEQPGTEYPLLGALHRNGRYYFVMAGPAGETTDFALVKEGFMAILQSVRPAE